MKKKDGHGQEGLELIAHHVGYQLDAAALRGREVSILRGAGYFKKAAGLRKEWREALASKDGQRIIAVLKEREDLRSWRRDLTSSLAPAWEEVRTGRAFLEKVAFPDLLAKAGVEPIRHVQVG